MQDTEIKFELKMLEEGLEGPFNTLDAMMPVLEHFRQNGAMVFIKMDGERPVGTNVYTLLMYNSSNEQARQDTDNLIEGLQLLILEYLELIAKT